MNTYLTYSCIYISALRQDDFCPEEVQYSSMPTMSKHILEAMLPGVKVNEESMHEGDSYRYHLAFQ